MAATSATAATATKNKILLRTKNRRQVFRCSICGKRLNFNGMSKTRHYAGSVQYSMRIPENSLLTGIRIR